MHANVTLKLLKSARARWCSTMSQSHRTVTHQGPATVSAQLDGRPTLAVTTEVNAKGLPGNGCGPLRQAGSPIRCRRCWHPALDCRAVVPLTALHPRIADHSRSLHDEDRKGSRGLSAGDIRIVVNYSCQTVVVLCSSRIPSFYIGAHSRNCFGNTGLINPGVVDHGHTWGSLYKTRLVHCCTTVS
jgi:hypothetical protein